MFACAYFRGWPRTSQPPIQAIGAKHVPDGIMCYLMHVHPNASRARTITLDLYNPKGKRVERVRVEWPGWKDVDMAGVTLSYA